MGKSEKKVKSDRINLLRKQYDAFLEEDKKRRERNEYILGKLDKMRMSTALVLRNRLSQLVIDPRSNPYDRYAYEDSKPLAPIQSLVPIKSYTSCRLDDQDMLKEISKKYILIPKLSPTFATEELHRHDTPITDTGDWKSKYDILTKLKQDEKEAADPTPDNISRQGKKNDNRLNSAPLDCTDIPVRDSDITTGSTDTNKVKFLDDMINPAQPIDLGEPTLFAEEEVNWTSNRNEDNPNLAAVDAINMGNVDVSAFPSQQENTALFGDEYQAETTDTDNVIYANVSKNNSSDDVHVVEDCNNEPQYAYVAQPETSVDKTIDQDKDLGNPYEINNYENNETALEYTQNGNLTEYLHNPSEEYQEMVSSSATPLAAANDQILTIQAQETQEYNEQSEFPVDVIKSEDLTPDPGVALVEGVKINTPGYEEGHVAVDEHRYDPNTQQPSGDQPTLEVNNTVDESQISEFDKENKEMFYSEEQNVAYEQYNTQEEYASNTEQAAPVAPVGAYDENGQFVYYEGDTQDTVYPVEYAENEATLQPYDQTYEQQYGDGMYGDQQYQQGQYDQQQYQQQGIEQPHLYENVEQYKEQPNENVEDVQQQLDQEQGYTEQVVLNEQEAPQVNTADIAKPEDTDPKPVDAAQTG